MNTHSTQTESQTFNLSHLIERAKLVLLSPKQCWDKISKETHEPLALLKSTIAPLIILNIICAVIGIQIFTKALGVFAARLGAGLELSLIPFFFSQILNGFVSIGMLFLGAFILHNLAPKFQGEVSKERAFIYLAHAMIPSLLGGLLAVIPPLIPLALIFSIVSMCALYFGATVMTSVPKERGLGFFIAFFICTCAISFGLGFLF
jgi:hypothetical protein